tara:strand:+ start:724722 stop:725048 length:327 start_codon:yes stop_codon:yes gene_type:complete
MAVLRKIKAATLTEIIVASAIILIVFGISSISVNNIFASTVIGNDHQMQNRIRELSYLQLHNKIVIPYYEENQQWEIYIEEQNGKIVLEANHFVSKKITTIDLNAQAP